MSLSSIKKQVDKIQDLIDEAYALYEAEVQRLVDEHKVHLVHLATGHMSDTWQMRYPRGKVWRDADDFPAGRVHPIFVELKVLDEVVEPFGIGPSNLEHYKPKLR